MKKSVIILVVLTLFSCKKEDTEPNSAAHNGKPLGTTQPVYDGFHLDLYVYDTLGHPMEGVLVESIELPYNGAVCGGGLEDFITDSTGHCIACTMYGHEYGSPPNEPDSQKFVLSYDGYINEIIFEVLIHDTTTYNHNFVF